MPLGLGLGITRLKSTLGALRVRFRGDATITATLDGILRELNAPFVSDGTVTAALEAIKLLQTDFSGDGIVTADLGGYEPSQDPDLFDWWDAQSGVTESGGELTAWVGSVNSESANPPTVTSRPLYGSDQINSLDVLTLSSADPNYLKITNTPNVNTVSLHIVIDITNTNGVVVSAENESGYYIRYLSGNLSKADNNGNMGGASVNYYVNGTLIGADITRDSLFDGLNDSGICVLTLENLDFTVNEDMIIGVRSNISLGVDGLIGDLIITEGTIHRADNVQYLMDKYNL